MLKSYKICGCECSFLFGFLPILILFSSYLTCLPCLLFSSSPLISPSSPLIPRFLFSPHFHCNPSLFPTSILASISLSQLHLKP